MGTLKQYRILVVDNNKTYIDVLKFQLSDVMLDSIEYLDEAYHGLHAIELVHDKTYDIVFMDIDMPILDGIDTTKFLRLNYPDLKVVALSLYCDEEHISSMLQAGADGYLVKDNLDDVAIIEIFQSLDFVVRDE